MKITSEVLRVRRELAVDYFRMVTGKEFKPEAGPFGFGFSSPLLTTLQHLCMRFPPNITYLTDGAGLYEADLGKLKTHAVAVDMQKILASANHAEMVLFGEDHRRNRNAHQFVRGSMQMLSAEGFRAYGVELIRVDDAEIVKGFNDGGVRERAALQSHIENPQNTGSAAIAADTHMEIFDAAKAEGMKVYPMTHPREWDNLTVAPSFLFGVQLGMETRARDCFMSLAVNQAIVERTKTVALTGIGHLDVNNGLPSILKWGFGYGVISVALVERGDVTEPFMVKYSREVRRIVPGFQTLNWSVNDAPPQEADWIIFFPHTPRSGLEELV